MPEDRQDTADTGQAETRSDVQGELGSHEEAIRRHLDVLGNQIRDAGERHSSLLTDMQRRLSELGSDVQEIREILPDELAAELRRIEQGLGTLVASIGTNPENHDSSRDGEFTNGNSRVSLNEGEDAPMVFKQGSSLSVNRAAGGARSQQRVQSPAASAIDPFDMVETSLPGDPETPWDEESADALVRVCEEQAEDPGGHDAFLLATHTPDPEDQPAAATFTSASSEPEMPASERVWLDKKFTEIADRIETALAELGPEKSFGLIGERFHEFESKLGDALQDVALRSDLESLRNLDAYFNDLSSQLAQTEAHLGRLGSIEAQLQNLSAHAPGTGTDEFGQPMPEPAHGLDPDRIAEVTAARLAEHLSASRMTSDATSDTIETRELIEGLLAANRQGNEQTAFVLDTIQQALGSILDRIETMELQQNQAFAGRVSGNSGYGRTGPDYGQPVTEDAETQSREWDGIEAWDGSPGPSPAEDVRRSGDSGWSGDEPVTAPGEMLTGGQANGETTADNIDSYSGTAGNGVTDAETPFGESHPSPDLISDCGASETPAGGSRAAIEQIRSNFIADAKRAKARAMREAAVENAPSKQGARKSLTSNGSGSKNNPPEGKGRGGMFGSKARFLLVGTLVLVILVNGAMFLLPNKRNKESSAAPAAAGEQHGSLHRRAAGARSFTPRIDERDVLANLRVAIMHEESRAAGAAELPFGLLLQQATANAWTRAGAVSALPAAVTGTSAPDLTTESRVALTGESASERAVELPPATVGPMSLRHAAANGDASAQFEVATRLAEGKGTDQNLKLAALWLKRSASQGFAQAQYRLGTLYERGLGLSRDENRARIWYLRAADQGLVKAMHNAAVMSADGNKGAADYASAAEWFLKAADHGLADSQFNLAVLYENGLGVDKDLKNAYKWYSLAARSGDEESLRRSQTIRSRLAIAELGDAEQAVRDFVSQTVDPVVNDARLAGQQWKQRQPGLRS